MVERLDAISGIKSKSGKTYWTRVGTAFPSKKGDGGYTLFLDYLPLNRSEDGKLVIALTVPKEREERSDPPPQRRPALQRQDDLDDDVPF